MVEGGLVDNHKGPKGRGRMVSYSTDLCSRLMAVRGAPIHGVWGEKISVPAGVSGKGSFWNCKAGIAGERPITPLQFFGQIAVLEGIEFSCPRGVDDVISDQRIWVTLVVIDEDAARMDEDFGHSLIDLEVLDGSQSSDNGP